MKMTDELTAYFRDLEQRDKFSGVALITRGAEQVYAGAFGHASRSWQVRNTLDVRFDTASITKLFTAIAVLQLIEQGMLAFDTRIVDFLGLAGTAISPDATVFHLLTHSSGIGDDADEEAGEDYADLWKTKANYSVTETADFLPQFVYKPANFPPGQGCRYCNCSFILLGLALEKVTGMRYRDYVRQHVFARAGMAHSDFLRMDRVCANVVEGCDPILDENERVIGWQKNIYSYPPVGSPDSGAYVTAADLDRCLRALQAGQLLSPKLTADFLTPKVYYCDKGEWRLMFGYVLEFHQDKSGQMVFYQKDGVNAGVSGIMRYFPQQDINVVLLSNMMNGVWDPVWYIHDMVVAGAFA